MSHISQITITHAYLHARTSTNVRTTTVISSAAQRRIVLVVVAAAAAAALIIHRSMARANAVCHATMVRDARACQSKSHKCVCDRPVGRAVQLRAGGRTGHWSMSWSPTDRPTDRPAAVQRWRVLALLWPFTLPCPAFVHYATALII